MRKQFRVLHKARKAAIASAIVAMSALGIGAGVATAATKAHAAAPIKIGLDITESGPEAPQSAGALQWFTAYIDYTNDHGGIDGHKIDVITLDDKGDPGQTLLNFEAMWTQDKVSLIASNIGAIDPLQYIQQNQIPVFVTNAATQQFSSHYTSTFILGGQLPAWSAQTAYWVVKIEKNPIKRVAVLYSPQLSAGFQAFVQNYWKKLGATYVDMVNDSGPTADCSALVLRWKSENVQYVDLQGFEAPSCVQAMARDNWRPKYSAGGPVTSQIGEAELIGKPFVGIVAGAPNTLYTGAPIHATPSAVDRTYVGNIRKYFPTWANYNNLNGTGIVELYGDAELVVAALKGTMAKYGDVTPAHVNAYTRTLRNFDDGLAPVILSFAPNCKTGSDGTIWGYWHYNAHPTASKPTLYMVPTSGPKFVTNTWLGLGECYLTKAANKLFPNG
jgi:ABC-type branched-subunit amino acid transport system substrate-binding protein